MLKLDAAKSAVSKMGAALGRSGLLTKKYTPEILIGAGILAIGTGTVMACRATLRIDEVLEKARQVEAKLDYVRQNASEEDFTASEYARGLIAVKTEKAKSLFKLYLPPVTMILVGVTCVLSAHGIMSHRNAALAAAYKVIEESYDRYRSRVIAKYGEAEDHEFRTGNPVDEKGELVVQGDNEEEVEDFYSQWFDARNKNFSRSHIANQAFLQGNCNYLNAKLQWQGHLFLNEVYDALDMDRTKAGTVTGWIKNSDGDNFVDFGLQNEDGDWIPELLKDNSPVPLNFNVDGTIYDKI